METNAITIIIADDHPMMAEGLASAIHENTPHRVAVCVHDGKSLLQKLNSIVPDLLIIDLNMPKVNGIDAAKQVKIRFPKIKILCISMYSEPGIYDLLAKVEVDGFVPKLNDTRVFIDAINKVIAGEKVFLKAKGGKYVKNDFTETDPFVGKLKLSDREIEILRLIKQGKDSKEIADCLQLSYYTVETHRKNICKKLNLHSPNALVKFAAGIEL